VKLKNLVSAFKKVTGGAIFGGALAAATGYQYLRETGRPLKAEEVQFVEGVFGNEVKTADIRLSFNSLLKYPVIEGITLYNQIIIESDNASRDFSRDQDQYGLFLHEMTHIWQVQNGVIGPRTICETYKYTITPESHFEDFCMEQQASIINDYANRFLSPTHEPKASQFLTINIESHVISGDTKASNALLKQVVEERFPRARLTRLALETPKPRPLLTCAKTVSSL
jgi:hypothetical protein